MGTLFTVAGGFLAGFILGNIRMSGFFAFLLAVISALLTIMGYQMRSFDDARLRLERGTHYYIAPHSRRDDFAI